MKGSSPARGDSRLRVIVLTAWVVYIYVFMEWLFFATMPSFMSTMGVLQKIGVFLLSGFLLALPITLLGACLALVSPRLAAVIPALVLSVLALILLDNFTYTLFKLGIVTSAGVWRAAYALGFVILSVYLWSRLVAPLNDEAVRPPAAITWGLVGLVGLSATVFLLNLPQFHLPERAAVAGGAARLPNIILIGIDGVDATHMSLYGYGRDTTPNISRLSESALVAENAFSNAGKTGGSLTSILTGKPSTETRVLFPPDILMGPDAYQHLPGILKQYGYHTVQITMQYYGDAFERNILDGFDIVNGRSEADAPLLTQFARFGGGGSAYFAGQMIFRAAQRMAHVFFIRQMQNPYEAVTKPSYALHDDQRMQQLFRYLDEAQTPLFVHVHLMDTHGPEFYVPHQYFSTAGEQNKDWNLDYYDDSIRDSDAYINSLFDHLDSTGKRGDTLVILYSDHGIEWSTLDRVPLLFWFPGQERTGSIRENVQLLDISPTILDYLDIPRPSWMSGSSLLEGRLSPARPIFSAVVNEALLRVTEDRTTWVVNEAKISPPFYELGKLDLVICDRWYSLNVEKPALTYGRVPGSTAECSRDNVPSPESATQLIVQYLQQERYDVRNLPAQVPMQAAQP